MARNTDPSSTASGQPGMQVAACLLLAMSVGFCLPIQGAGNGVIWASAIAASVILNVVAVGSASPANRASGRILPFVAFPALLLPLPWSVGPWLLAAGLGLDLSGRSARLAAALTLTGCTVFVQLAAVVPYLAIADRLGAFVVGPACAALFREVLQFDLFSSEGANWVSHRGDTKALVLTLDSIGCLPVALTLASLLAFGRNSFGNFRRYLLPILVYAALRLLLVLVACVEWPGLYRLALLPWGSAVTFLPLAIALAADRQKARLPLPHSPAVGYDARRRTLWLPVAATGLAACLVGIYSVDPGTEKAGRILVDDSHGSWEPGKGSVSDTEFGAHTMYSYVSVWDWVGRHYPLQIHTQGRLDAKRLEDVDVLVLKMPSVRYDEGERAAILDFVRKGGGLWVVGDHTNVFGTTTVLNEVLEPFELRLGEDIGLLLDKRGAGNYRYRIKVPLPSVLLGGRRTALDLMGAASVRSTGGLVEHALLCTAQALESLDYRDGSYFGDREITLDDAVRPFCVCLTKRFGLGKICAWTDSTIFSSFAVFEPGKPELVMGILGYLNRRPTYPAWCRWGLVVAGGLVALIASLAAWTRGLGPLGLAAVLAWAGALARAGTEAAWSAWAHPVPEPSPYTVVAFDLRSSEDVVDYPWAGGCDVEQQSRSNRFASLFASILRMEDAFPLGLLRDEQLERTDVLVIADLARELTRREIDRIYERVTAGMRLLVISSSMTDGRRASALLDRVFMRFEPSSANGLDIHRSSRLPEGLMGFQNGSLALLDAANLYLSRDDGWGPGSETPWSGASIHGVRGGTPHWVAANSVPVLSSAAYGRGRVWGCSLGMQMTTEALGNSSAGILPEDPQASRYKGLTALMDLVRRGGPDHGRHAHVPLDATEHGSRSESREDIEDATAAYTEDHADVLAEAGADADTEEYETAGAEGHAEDRNSAAMLGEVDLDLSSSHAREDKELTVSEVMRALESRRMELRGSAAADVFVFQKDATTVAFLCGYVIENGRRSVLRLVGCPATGTLDERASPVTVDQDASSYRWALPGRPVFHGLERDASEGLVSVLYPRLRDVGGWQLRVTDDVPAGELEKRIRVGGLEATSKQLWDREAQLLYGEDRNWVSEPVAARCLVLSQTETEALSPYHVGKQEIWLNAETLRLRKLVLVYRRRGDVGVTSWKQLVCVFFDHRSHGEDALNGDPTGIRDVLLLGPQQAAFVLEGTFR